jgi:gliding motility-associated-like protein
MEVVCGEPYIYVPNAFTPNGDGNNDILYAYGDIIDELYFAVYDRWGEIMFESTDITKGWDGTYHGSVLDPAVFVYYIKAICRDKETFIKKGNVTLIR